MGISGRIAALFQRNALTPLLALVLMLLGVFATLITPKEEEPQIDVTMAVPQTKLEVYAQERPAELHRAPVAETRFLTFNTRRTALADTRVRQALSLAIDRTRIVERVMRGGQEPAWRFVPPALRASDQPAAHSLTASASASTPTSVRDDPTEARRLLAAAGFPEGKGFPRLELTAWSASQSVVLEAIQAMWRQELGIEIAVGIREAKVHLAALHSGDYDISFVTTTALLDVADPFALLANFTAGADNNFPHWRSPEFDALLAEAAAQPDATAQSALLLRAETTLLDAMPIAPLYFNTRNWLMSPRVQGWQEDAFWTRDYTTLRLEP